MTPDLLSIVPKFSNIWVPPWVPFSPQMPNFRDEEIDLALDPVTLTGTNTQVLNNVLAFDSDADYFIRELQFIVLPTTSAPIEASDIRVRIKDGDGHLFTNDFCYAQDLCGPLCPPWPIRAGATLIVDFQNECQTTDTVIVIQLVLKGYKRRACSNVAVPLLGDYIPMRRQYPPAAEGEEYRDFCYPQRFDNIDEAPTPSNLLKFPIQMDNDADFILRGVCGQWQTTKDSFPTTGDVALTLYDANSTPWNDRFLPESWGGNYGQVRELSLTNGGRITPLFPEVRVRRGSVIQVDISFGTVITIFRFGLRGVKAYNKGDCK